MTEDGRSPAAPALYHHVHLWFNAAASTEVLGLLATLAATSLLGNALFPVGVRWCVVALEQFSGARSSSRVFWRYLLLRGRECYSCLFLSQQTRGAASFLGARRGGF